MAEKKIEGETYRVDPMPAKEALELLGDLMRVLTQGTSQLPVMLLGLQRSEAGDEQGGQVTDIATLAALGDVLDKNRSSDLADLVERVVTKAQVRRPSGYSTIVLDDDFSGRLEAIVPVARFVLETNYAPFFAASAGSGLLRSLRAAFGSTK